MAPRRARARDDARATVGAFGVSTPGSGRRHPEVDEGDDDARDDAREGDARERKKRF